MKNYKIQDTLFQLIAIRENTNLYFFIFHFIIFHFFV